MANDLIREKSPYLLQHAHNPVQWKAWGEKAFNDAAQQNKPVLLSIGYSSCHWCHVMERESFEDESTAALMNEGFINIKVDREELPDVDHYYMQAVQAMTGSGGWPLHVFLTPDKKAFYGGTYFPPKRMGGRASWKEVLHSVMNYYSERREDANIQAMKLEEHLGRNLFSPVTEQDENDSTHEITLRMMKQADREHGGFGSAPKFPSATILRFLSRQGSDSDKHHVLFTLRCMAQGGIHDHVGGGFSRYSTDNKWRVPHFEKMLYDNAQLLGLYAWAFHKSEDPVFYQALKGIFHWLNTEMHAPEGGYFSAQDADTEGEEGLYYLWTWNELQEVLGSEGVYAAGLFNCSENGNFEYRNILYITAESLAATQEQHIQAIPVWMNRLYQYRMNRPRPFTDTKIILSWNALCITNMLEAFLYTRDKIFLETAQKELDGLWNRFRKENQGWAHYRIDEHSCGDAYADDLVYLAEALFQMGLITGQETYYQNCCSLADHLLQFFRHGENPLITYSDERLRGMPWPQYEIYDHSLPSPNAVFCGLLQKLDHLWPDSGYGYHSETMYKGIKQLVHQYPSSFAFWCQVGAEGQKPQTEVHILGPLAAEYYSILYTKSNNSNVQFVVSAGGALADRFGGNSNQRETLIFICRNQHCLPPFRDVKDALTEI